MARLSAADRARSAAERKRRRKAELELRRLSLAYQAAARPVVKRPPPPKGKEKDDEKKKKDDGFSIGGLRITGSDFYDIGDVASDLLKPGKALIKGAGILDRAGTPRPVSGAVRNLGELGSGIPGAAGMFGSALWHDRNESLIDMGSDWRDYFKLAQWTLADEKGDTHKRPKTDSHVAGLLADMIRSWGRGIERGIPDPTDKDDMKEAGRAWRDDPVFTALDVFPFAAAVTRPASVGRHALSIGRANEDLGRLGALRAGAKESYRPGAARRAGLEGGIGERIHSAPFGGEIAGRPYSRTPLVRELQRMTDDLYGLSPTLMEKRVGRGKERLGREEQRRMNLAVQELSAPVARLVYGRMGRMAGAFALRETMNAAERARARLLTTAFQLDRHLINDPEALNEALNAVVADKTEILNSGKIEVVGDNGRVKQMDLKTDQKQALVAEVADMERGIADLREGRVTHEELGAALDSMGIIADKTHELGMDILQRRHGLDDDEMMELTQRFARRASILPRRLRGRGYLGGALRESEERTARIDEWERTLGEDKARALTALFDRIARRMNPADPALFYRDKVGMPSGESAEELVARVGQDPEVVRYQEFGEYGETPLIEGDALKPAPTSAFYSPLQKWADDTWPPGRRIPPKELKGKLKRLPQEAYEQANFDQFFEEHAARTPPNTPITREEFDQHLATPLNAYNLREHHYSNDPRAVAAGFGTQYDEKALVSREPGPGEYHELVYETPNPRVAYRGKGEDHWNMENVTFHVRLHDFPEGDARKGLVDEVQSDHANDYRLNPAANDDEARRAFEEQEDPDGWAQEALWDLADERSDLYDEYLKLENDPALASQERRAEITARMEEIERDMETVVPKEGSHPVPPSPLGPNRYIRTMARRLARYAKDNGLDQIIISDPTVHHLRNSDRLIPGLSRLDLNKMEPSEVRAVLDENESPMWRRLYLDKVKKILDEELGVQGRVVDDAYEGRYSGGAYGAYESLPGGMRGLVYDVTDEVIRRGEKSQALFQRQPDWKALPKGATEYLEGGRTRIHGLEGADVSTWIHELAHVALPDLPEAERRILEAHYAGGKTFEEWAEDANESFARDFENYMRRGKAPTKELASIFAKLAEWVRVVWANEKREGTKLDPEVQGVFDRVIGHSDDGDMETWGYFPHRDLNQLAQSEYRGGVRPPATGPTIGRPRMSSDQVNTNPNEMLLYQTGRLSPDPAQLIDVLLRRVRFQETLNARDELYAAGRPMSEPPPKNAWLIRDPDSTPERIRPQERAAVKGEPTTLPVEKADLEALEGKLSGDAEEIRRQMIAKPGEHPEWASDLENVRWVPKEVVESRFGEVFEQRPRGGMWSALGLANSLQRITGIYGRPLSYIGGNIPFNITALMATAPISTLKNAGRAMRIAKEDPELYRMMASETGETRASGGLPEFYVSAQNKLQESEQKWTQRQRAAADVLSKAADTPFRVTAFLTAAGKRADAYTNAELRELIEEGGSDLADVRQITREQMLDFDALNPSQRRLASNLFYLYPFIYASVKWPFMYAREYPVRAGLAAQAAEKGNQDEPLSIANLWLKHGVDLSTLNPLGAMSEIAEQGQAFVNDPSQLDLTVLQERLSPTLAAAVEGMGGGKKNALINYIRQTIPGAAELASFDPRFRGGKQFGDQSQAAYLAQRHARFYPRGINPEVVKERIDDFRRDQITTPTHELERDADWKKIERYYKAVGGDGDALTKSYSAWWDYQEARDQKKEMTGQRKLTPVQEIEILTEIAEEKFPEIQGELWDLGPMRDDEYQSKYKKELEDYAKSLKDYINQGRTDLFNDYRSYASED
jgi:hypothetical protein